MHGESPGQSWLCARTVLTGEAGRDLSALLRYPAALFPGKSGFHIIGGGGGGEASLPRKILFENDFSEYGRRGCPLKGLSLPLTEALESTFK